MPELQLRELGLQLFHNSLCYLPNSNIMQLGFFAKYSNNSVTFRMLRSQPNCLLSYTHTDLFYCKVTIFFRL